MALSVVQMFWGLAVIIFSMWSTMRRGIRPWISWDDDHFQFSNINQFPAILAPQKDMLCAFIQWWNLPISSFLFFVFFSFSFGQDAMKEYRSCCLWIERTIFRVDEPSERLSKSASASLPVLVSATHRLVEFRSTLHVAHAPEVEVSFSHQSPSPTLNSWTPNPSEYLHSDSSPSYEGYQWDPPTSPTLSTSAPRYCATSDSCVFDGHSKSKEMESWTDMVYLATHPPTKCKRDISEPR